MGKGRDAGKRFQRGFGGIFKRFTGRVKFRYLGLGFLWAWIYATWMTPAVFPKSAGLTVQNDISWLISCGTVVPALFLIPLLMKGRDVSSVPWFRRLGGIGTSIGAIMMAAEPLFGIELPAVAYLGGILTGVASALLWICWGEFSGKVDIEISEVRYPARRRAARYSLSTSFF